MMGLGLLPEENFTEFVPQYPDAVFIVVIVPLSAVTKCEKITEFDVASA